MQHNLSLKCVRYALRPVTVEDAPFIVELRSDPLRNRFLHEISPRIEDQIAWLKTYFARPQDYYFIVQEARSGEPHGAIGIYDIDETGGGQWGRWVLKRNSAAGLESAWLVHEVGFSLLGLTSLSSRTIVENAQVVSFHRSFGATEVAVLKAHFLVSGRRESAVEHRIAAAEWPSLRARHYSLISKAASRTHP